MTAVEAYWQAVEDGEIPGSVIVESEDGVRGLATVSFSVEGNARAQRYALSDDRRERAIAAIFACRTSIRSLHKYHEELLTPAE